MNPKFESIIDIMRSYDSAQIGSKEREEAGLKLDKQASHLKDRDIISIKCEYERRFK